MGSGWDLGGSWMGSGWEQRMGFRWELAGTREEMKL
jgi:hypothetical protein